MVKDWYGFYKRIDQNISAFDSNPNIWYFAAGDHESLKILDNSMSINIVLQKIMSKQVLEHQIN